MDVVLTAGVRPLVRAGILGAVVALGALLVQLRILTTVLGPSASELVLAALGVAMVVLAMVAGGAAGAWQAAMAGVPDRRSVVAVGAAAPIGLVGLTSVILSVATGADPVLSITELPAVAAGGLAGAWLFPRIVVAVSRLAGSRGQTAVEYLGILLVVGLIVAALAGIGPQIAGLLSDRVDSIPKGGAPAGQVDPGTPSDDGSIPGQESDGGDPAAEIDADGDGLSLEEEQALGTDDGAADSDGDGVSDADEYLNGTDPAQGVEPLTPESLMKPWERIGLSEQEWKDLEDKILDEVNPGGWKSFLLGDNAGSIALDENGELVLVPPGALLRVDEDGKLEINELQENGVGGGLVKGLAKLLGAGGRAVSPAVKSALAKLSPALRTKLARIGLGGAPGKAARLPRDLAVNSTPPRALPTTGRSVGRASHDAALQQKIASLPKGATDIRVNQQQVNAAGQRVGINRPDLQYTVNGKRYYVEYEGVGNPRGAIHEARIKANDPNAVFDLQLVP